MAFFCSPFVSSAVPQQMFCIFYIFIFLHTCFLLKFHSLFVRFLLNSTYFLPTLGHLSLLFYSLISSMLSLDLCVKYSFHYIYFPDLHSSHIPYKIELLHKSVTLCSLYTCSSMDFIKSHSKCITFPHLTHCI